MKEFVFAKVLKPQGIKGEIKVEFFVSDIDFAKNLKYFISDGVKFNIEKVRLNKKYGFIKTTQVSTRNQAEELRGKLLSVKSADKPLLKLSEFFISDLENCCVTDEYGNILGFVESIEKYGAADIVNILSEGTIKSFPLLEKVIKKIDIKNKQIIVFKNFLEEVLI